MLLSPSICGYPGPSIMVTKRRLTSPGAWRRSTSAHHELVPFFGMTGGRASEGKNPCKSVFRSPKKCLCVQIIETTISAEMSDLETLFPNPTDGARSCRHLSPSDLFVPTAGPTGPLLGPLSGPPPSGQVPRSLLVTESRKTVHFAAYEDRSFFIYTFCTVPGSLICQSSLFFFVLAFFVAPCPARCGCLTPRLLCQLFS